MVTRASVVLLFVVVACGAPLPVEVTTGQLSDTAFYIRALGDRCIDISDKGTGSAALTIQPCRKHIDQLFRIEELDSHDFQLRPEGAPSECIMIEGPTGPALHIGQRLVRGPCGESAAQRFAFDGDALLVGRQSHPADRVSRDFVIEPSEGNTNVDTPVVVATRDLDDAEYWRFIPEDGSETRPHSGFITIDSETELALALLYAEWGQVLELDPPDDEVAIVLDSFPLSLAPVKSGVTLRGGHKFFSTGVLLVIPPDRTPKTGFVLQLEDHARITQLRMDGSNVPEMWALQIGIDKPDAPSPVNVIVDHVDLSRWSVSAISMFGPVNGVSIACPAEPAWVEPHAKLVGNFIHHHEVYGIAVAAGAVAFIRGNYMFGSRHDLTSGFHSGFNRYLAYDNLFTSADEGDTIVDVHGSCEKHWTGGRAGDFFDVAWNSFLTGRSPLVNVRGTPCQHFLFRHNLATQSDPSDTVLVTTDPDGPCDAFVDPGDPADILQMHDNQFGVDNPLHRKLAVGDFDGDGRDDVFFGTGVTWWFSSGGKPEWRFLGRKPELVSELRFGDFDADGRTDVVALHDNRLEVSWAGESRWFPLNTALPGLTIEDLAVGQFDANPGADLFVADGSQWHWSSGGTGTWDFFAFSGYRAWQLRFGDFTGDGITDVFRTENNNWSIVRGPLHQWEPLGTERVPVDINRITVADFDGDGLADVGADRPTLGSSLWMVSSHGTSDAQLFHIDDQLMSMLPIGRFDDRDGDDVIRWYDETRFWLNSPFADELWSTQAMR